MHPSLLLTYQAPSATSIIVIAQAVPCPNPPGVPTFSSTQGGHMERSREEEGNRRIYNDGLLYTWGQAQNTRHAQETQGENRGGGGGVRIWR
jgi:hypothetical protein